MRNQWPRDTTGGTVGRKALGCLSLVTLASLTPLVCGGQTKTLTWSTHDCADCQSTITNPGWYSDGSGLFTEAMQIGDQYVTAALSVSDNNIVLAVGFATVTGSYTVSPSQAVSIESDSSANIVLLPTNGPASRIPKSDVTIKKQFKKGATVAVSPGHLGAGYLFFPNDPDASAVTVLVTFGDASFIFPFRRNPNFKAKFGPLDVSSAISPAQLAVSPDNTAAPNPGNVGRNPPGPSTGSRLNDQIITAQGGSPSQSGLMPKSTGKCSKNIAFASIDGGQPSAAGPSFADKWVEKNAKKYPDLCFVKSPSPDKSNVLLVFSTSQNAFNGFYPTTRTTTSTNTSPTYGSGTITNNYGEMWNYDYSGTITSTMTSTQQIAIPYTDTTHSLYVYVYDSTGNLLSRHSRSITTRQGGDGANTLGYNLGAALGAIHLKDGLLKEAVESVSK